MAGQDMLETRAQGGPQDGSQDGIQDGIQDGPEVARRGIMLVLSSPSGAGKTTLSRMLLERYGNIDLSISVTTRTPRPGEVDGKDYHFIDRARFDEMVTHGELFEWAEVFGNRYGTPRGPVERVLAEGRDVLFDIDWQGTQQLREKGRDDLVSVFVLPPSIPALEARLRTRAQDSDTVIQARMSKASDEMSHWAEYDYVVINRDVIRAFEHVCAILAAERLKRERQTGLSAFVRALQAGL
jgi:guanylate kinase